MPILIHATLVCEDCKRTAATLPKVMELIAAENASADDVLAAIEAVLLAWQERQVETPLPF